MINGNITEFIDQLNYGQEIVFSYKDNLIIVFAVCRHEC